MERRYQVFISSTYTDLVDERREVIQALLEMDCLPAGMEMFPAANEDQWSLIKEVIDQSDYYIVVVGGRYGSTTEEGISYTEKEYDYAVDSGIPVLGFVHADATTIPFGKSEIDKKARDRLESFRKKVMTRMVKTYSTPGELGSVVSRAVNRLIRHNPRDGWVRGHLAMTPETRAEVAELRAALAEAEKKQAIGQSDRGMSDLDLSYEHGSDTVELTFVYSGIGDSYGRESYTGTLTYTWDQIVETLGPFMLDQAPEPQLRQTWNAHMLADLFSGDGPDDVGRLSREAMSISDSSWGSVIVQLRALGIIRIGTKKRTVSDKSVYWTLTPGGDQYLVNLRAVKRPVQAP